jgi:hypothetical protein
MSIARSVLNGGPAHLTFKSAAFHLLDDAKLAIEPVTEVLNTSMYGQVDEYYSDLLLKGSGTPLEYGNQSILWPYLQPIIGSRIFGDSDSPLAYLSNNGDLFTLIAAAITKMPSLFLGVDKPIIGPVEFAGVIGTGLDPETASSYYTKSSGNAYTPVALTVGNAKRQRYSAAWGAITGFTAFQAEEGWSVDFDVKLEPVKIQSRTVDMKITGISAMAKCKPVGPTFTQIDTNQHVQGTGGTSGSRRGGNSADLIITGSGVSVTLKNAFLKTAGFVFGGKPLRNDEVAWVSTIDVSSGTASAVAVLA